MFKRKRKPDVRVSSDSTGKKKGSDFLVTESKVPDDARVQNLEDTVSSVQKSSFKHDAKKRKSPSNDKDTAEDKSVKTKRSFTLKIAGNRKKSKKVETSIQTDEILQHTNDKELSSNGLVETLNTECKIDRIADAPGRPRNDEKDRESFTCCNANSIQEPLTNEVTTCSSGNHHLDMKDENAFNGMCSRIEEYIPGAADYSSFLRDMDRATGSSIIQSDDSYEKLRYTSPRMTRCHEECIELDENWRTRPLRIGKKSSPGRKRKMRDMETRNSNDIIISGSLEGEMLRNEGSFSSHLESSTQRLSKVRPEAEDSFLSGFQNHSTQGLSGETLASSTGKTHWRKSTPILDYSTTKTMSMYRKSAAETKTKAGAVTCGCEAEIKVVERSLKELESSIESHLSKVSRNEETFIEPRKRPANGEELLRDTTITNSADSPTTCRDLLKLHSPLRYSSTMKFREHRSTERPSLTRQNLPEVELRSNFQPPSYGSRRSCRCGNGCGTSDNTTCCCKRI